jgi:hypothetical protein
MTDFHNERERFHRYYTKDTYDRAIAPRMISPTTNRRIELTEVSYYIAELDELMPAFPIIGGHRGRKARRTRRNKRRST